MKDKILEDLSPALLPLIDAARSGFSRICGGDRGDGT